MICETEGCDNDCLYVCLGSVFKDRGSDHRLTLMDEMNFKFCLDCLKEMMEVLNEEGKV